MQAGVGEQPDLRGFALGPRAAANEDDESRRREVSPAEGFGLRQSGDGETRSAKNFDHAVAITRPPHDDGVGGGWRGHARAYRPGAVVPAGGAACARAVLAFSVPTGGPPGPNVSR